MTLHVHNNCCGSWYKRKRKWPPFTCILKLMQTLRLGTLEEFTETLQFSQTLLCVCIRLSTHAIFHLLLCFPKINRNPFHININKQSLLPNLEFSEKNGWKLKILFVPEQSEFYPWCSKICSSELRFWFTIK